MDDWPNTNTPQDRDDSPTAPEESSPDSLTYPENPDAPEIPPEGADIPERLQRSPANIAEQSRKPLTSVSERTKQPPANVAESASVPAIPITPEAWRRAGNEPLFRSARFRRQARRVRDALTRTDGDRRRVALARDENAPFPIPELFCLASAERIGARDYWVFAFDRQEWPVL